MLPRRAAQRGGLIKECRAMFGVADDLVYAGFWRRSAALLLDALFLLPNTALNIWIFSRARLYPAYGLVPNMVLGFFYNVYLVRRFGGTPGKLIMGLQITGVGGEPVTFSQAFLRTSPELLLNVLGSVTLLLGLLRLSDVQFHSLPFVQRIQQVTAMEPRWSTYIHGLQNIWIWGELVVLLTNEKRRALHDFIAGTVVIRKASDTGRNNALETAAQVGS
jgi:uncharacterized RDD family membrane protein YckC